MRVRHQSDVAGNADRPAALKCLQKAHWLAIGSDEPVGGRSGRRRFPAIDRAQNTAGFVVIEQEATTADAARLRFYNGQREHHCHRRVSSRAAFTQYLDPRIRNPRIGGGCHADILGEQRLRDDKRDGENKFFHNCMLSCEKQ